MERLGRLLALIGFILIVGLGLTGPSMAATTFFDFESGTGTAGPLAGLDNYMDTTFGQDINLPRNATSNIEWVGQSSLFGSDALFTAARGTGDGSNAANSSGINGIIDFDPSDTGDSAFYTEEISFTWGFFTSTGTRDFGLDVYDDAIGSWRNNIFEVNGSPSVTNQTGVSPLIFFDPTWEVTRIRFHNNGVDHVGIDNLTVVSSVSVPEPGTILLMGLGLLGLVVFGRKKLSMARFRVI